MSNSMTKKFYNKKENVSKNYADFKHKCLILFERFYYMSNDNRNKKCSFLDCNNNK